MRTVDLVQIIQIKLYVRGAMLFVYSKSMNRMATSLQLNFFHSLHSAGSTEQIIFGNLEIMYFIKKNYFIFFSVNSQFLQRFFMVKFNIFFLCKFYSKKIFFFIENKGALASKVINAVYVRLQCILLVMKKFLLNVLVAQKNQEKL